MPTYTVTPSAPCVVISVWSQSEAIQFLTASTTLDGTVYDKGQFDASAGLLISDSARIQAAFRRMQPQHVDGVDDTKPSRAATLDLAVSSFMISELPSRVSALAAGSSVGSSTDADLKQLIHLYSAAHKICTDASTSSTMVSNAHGVIMETLSRMMESGCHAFTRYVNVVFGDQQFNQEWVQTLFNDPVVSLTNNKPLRDRVSLSGEVCLEQCYTDMNIWLKLVQAGSMTKA